MKKYLLFLPMLLGIGLLGCEHEDAKVELSISSESSFAMIEADGLSGEVTFPFTGGSAEIAVETNQNFEVDKSNADWVNVAQSSNKVTLTCEENTNASSLQGTITITAGKGADAVTATIEVSQLSDVDGELYITLNPGELAFESTGGTKAVEVDTNSDIYTVGTPSETWVTTTENGNTISVLAEPNVETEIRTATIIVSVGAGEDIVSDTINIEQAASDEELFITLNPDLITFEAEGSVETIEVFTNGGSYSIGTPSESWVTPSKDGNIISLTASANPTLARRSATLLVSVGSGENIKTATLNIEQKFEDPDAMIVTLDIPADETYGMVPIFGLVSATVDWGDGNVEIIDVDYMVDDTKRPMHLYAKAGRYEVIVSGEVQAMNALSMDETSDYLVEVKQWGRLGVSIMESAFEGCWNLKSIPSDTQGSFANVITFAKAFAFTGLESIPSDIFKYATEAYNFIGVFQSALGEGRLKSIPAELFANNPKAISFEKAFSEQNKITSIPETLFEKNTLAFDFTEVFRNVGITTIPENLFAKNGAATTFSYAFTGTPLSSIPANLFKGNPAVETFHFTFASCKSLKTIPAELFKYNTNVKSFYSMFANSGIETIPAGLFDTNTAATEVRDLFYGCAGLKTIPAGLFKNNTALTNISGVFRYCTQLTAVPTGLFNTSAATTAANMFQNCTALTSVPSDLFTKMPNLTLVQNVFQDCKSLATLPSGLLSNLPNVTTFMEVFMGCSALKTIPADLLTGSIKVAKMQNVFRNCTSLETIPAGLFDSQVAVTDITGLFAGNTNLNSVPVSIFDNNKKLNMTNIVFEGCSSLTGESPYTMVNDQKVHLYERSGGGFSYIMAYTRCFSGCTGLSDYSAMPGDWK